jgi:uncharacterized membrane protein YheB (UPF0754 family)
MPDIRRPPAHLRFLHPSGVEFLTNAIVIDFVLLPLIGACHGWLTNVIALKLLFRPANEVKFLGLKFQGLLPRRKEEIAESIGDIVENELLRIEDIKEQLSGDGTLDQLSRSISKTVADTVYERLPRLIPASMRDTVSTYLEQRLNREVKPIIERFLSDASRDDLMGGRIKGMVCSRIRGYDVAELEKVAKSVVGKELKAIENLGFVMGLGIGIIQGFFLLILRLLSLYG